MEEPLSLPKRPWDIGRIVPVIKDEQTPWKLIRLLRVISLSVVGLLVFGLVLCSKTSFLLLITLANDGTKVLPADQKPVALLCIGCALITSSVLLLQKSLWKACYKTSKIPEKKTVALVLFFEFVVSAGAAILTIVAMPHLDIVTNVTILNGIGILSALLQVISQCSAKERNRFLAPSITSVGLLLLGFILFLVLYITKDPSDTKMLTWMGLAVGACFLVSFNWWENYFRLISENSSSVFLKNLCHDVTRCENVLNILSSLLRIAVTAVVLGAYVPLSGLDWDVVTSIPRRQTKIIAIIIGVQIISSALCHWFSLAACKMHALRSCFIVPLYLASLSVMALLVIPVIVYYYDYRATLNGTQINFTGYCHEVIYSRNDTLTGSVFPHLVHDVTHTLCFLDMSRMFDIGVLTGSAVSWWLGLVLATVHLWSLGLYRIQRTQQLFIRRLYEGAFMEQSLLLNVRFEVQKTERRKKFRTLEPVKVFLCATMWHETYDEMMKMIISIFRLDEYRPKKDSSDVTFEAHIYFDDAFRDVPGSLGRHVNEYAEMLVEIIKEVFSIFLNLDKGMFRKQHQVPEQTVVRTPYGGRLVVTMPQGNSMVVHFKDKNLIRHKKRWSQVMYLYYLLGWKLATKYYKRWQKGEDEQALKMELQKEKHNTYLLALDGDTDFQPSAVMLLIDRLKLYPKVGAACGRIHPTGSGPMVWYQKFEYAVGHWLHKTAEHVFGCVLCSPGCFSLFRAAALMDDNVMKKYTIKASQARHHIQYDQGEDRWLCTLLLKQGWRVEYNAAADAYTNAPEEFKEFYNQRRRWGPSTMANIVDLLGSGTLITKKNSSMSRPYMLYQLFSLSASILAPSTVIIMIAGSLTVILDVSPNGALVIAVIPPIIFLGVSFKIKSDTQIKIAGVMSVLYAFTMMITAIAIISTMVKDNTILTPSSIFIVALAVFYLVTALLHPQEMGLVIYGLLYILCIPSAYLLLAIYSMVNMNNVSWGTRETAPPAAAPKPEVVATDTPPQKAVENKMNKFISWLKRCPGCRCMSKEEPAVVLKTPAPPEIEPEILPQNTIVEEETIQRMEQRVEEPEFTCPNQCWVTQLQSLSDDMHLQEDLMPEEEAQFFRDLTVQYLEPLPANKKKQKKMADKLKQLRNKITFVYFLFNAFWLVATFSMQLEETSIFIRVPKVDINLDPTGEYIFIDPLGFMFILAFILLVILQFIAMLYHRVYTLIHFVAFTDTDSKFLKQQAKSAEVKKLSETSGEPSDDESDFMFPGLLPRSRDLGTLV